MDNVIPIKDKFNCLKYLINPKTDALGNIIMENIVQVMRHYNGYYIGFYSKSGMFDNKGDEILQWNSVCGGHYYNKRMWRTKQLAEDALISGNYKSNLKENA